ncbi:MAG: phosphonate C-P lyase system protein PhnG [Leptothrix sp. (in: b-proteobacteria)]
MTDHAHQVASTFVTPARRAEWLRLLAQAEACELAHLAAPLLADYRFDWLRRPEPGLVMVRARIGNAGDRFNLGEATITRCAVRHQHSDGSVVAGVGHVLGVAEQHAEQVAQLDALLQVESLHALLWHSVIEPLRALAAQRQHDAQARTETSRVQFFTLQPDLA